MKTAISLALVGAAAAVATPLIVKGDETPEMYEDLSPELEAKFQAFIAKHGKSFKTLKEYLMRRGWFMKMHRKIEAHNAQEGSTYTLAHNFLSDLTDNEYRMMLGGRVPNDYDQILLKQKAEATNLSSCQDNNAYCASWASTGECQRNPGYMLPQCALSCHQCSGPSPGPSPGPTPSGGSLDWRTKGAVNPVKNQGQCGSCWSFSATAALEGGYFVKTGRLLSFAEQQFVDCDKSNHGCSGGWQGTSFDYAAQNYLMAESSYQYTAKDGSCRYDGRGTGVKASSNHMVGANNISSMKAAVSQQPISVLIEADRSVFSAYHSGVFNNSGCGTALDHAVSVVGYGSDGNQSYWIMRNSWGSSWGESGYMRVAQVSGEGICGIQKSPYIVNF